MIRKVVIRRFKRFMDETLDLPGHIVLAGPNNSGKTTVLQAIAAWGLALRRWKELNDFQRHKGAYSYAPLTRHVFASVPLRAFDLLWNGRNYSGAVEIAVTDAYSGVSITMQLIADSTEQIYVRPKPDVDPDVIRAIGMDIIYVPSMTGLGTAEPVYQKPKLDQLLGQGKPGEVLRNLLVQAHQSEKAWDAINHSIRRLFHCELLPPDSSVADIIAEYRLAGGGTRLDIASAGSGFQQVLMLLTFLHTHPGAILLIDEPDAHLHVILQDAIYGELRSVAARTQSQLIIATHSEVIIDTVDPSELCLLLDHPRLLSTTAERSQLVEALRILDQIDILQAAHAPGVLYVEDFTDANILREWARVLRHPLRELLDGQFFWKKVVSQSREGGKGVKARDHYDALRLVNENLPAVELLDGDAHLSIPPTEITGSGLQRLRWRRYEIESYLLHPESLVRYVEQTVGGPRAAENVTELRKHFEEKYPPGFIRDPLGEYPFLVGTKARTDLLPPALDAAGLPGLPYTRYHEIAAVMKPEEIHPEVIEKLDAIQKAFRL